MVSSSVICVLNHSVPSFVQATSCWSTVSGLQRNSGPLKLEAICHATTNRRKKRIRPPMTSKRCRRRRRRACRLAGEGDTALRTDRTISSGEAVALILLPPAVHVHPREPAINAHVERQTPVETVF